MSAQSVWRITRLTWLILTTVLREPLADSTLSGNGITEKDNPSTKPPTPRTNTPVKTAPPKPVIPPTPRKPVQEPIPSPKGEPFPTPPPRKLPKPKGGDGRKSVEVSSEVSFTLATRTYGCMLYTPVSSYAIGVNICDGEYIYNELDEGYDNSLLSFLAWVLKTSNVVLDALDDDPAMQIILNSLGLGEGIEQFLANRFCQLAFAGLNLITKGKLTGVVSNPIIIAGCEGIAKLALNYVTRNQAVVSSLPIITHGYSEVVIIPCPPSGVIEPPGELPERIIFQPKLEEDTCSPVLLPDSAAFMNAGKYLVLYWVLSTDPSYRTYVTTWQIPKPKQQIWDVIDDKGNIIPGKANGIWAAYFAGVTRVQGYQYARYYAEGFRKPVFQGHFSSKDEAEKVFEKLLNMSDITPRTKAPIVFGASEKKDYLKDLSHEGKMLKIRKAVVIDKVAWKDSAKCVVTYTESKRF